MNEEKLENWWKTYKSYPKLSISEVKSLYQQYQKTKDPQIFEEMVNGTMYLIYNQLKNNYYLNYDMVDFDIEDIIMDSIELWLNYLKSGKVLKLEIFSDYFIRNFHEDLINHTLKTSIMNVTTLELYGIGNRTMADVFFLYVHGLNTDSIPLKLQDIFKQLIEVADEINIDLKLVPSRKFDIILKPLINRIIKENLKPNIEVPDEYEKIINQCYFEQIENKIRLATTRSIILQSYCGFYSDKPKSIKELALEYNCSTQNIEQKIKRELKRIRKQVKL